MPLVKFTADFDWMPTPRSMIAYKAGTVKNVTRRCAEKAKAQGKAKAAKAVKRKPADAAGS